MECTNSDGLTGFYYSHDGYWDPGFEFQGSISKLECANTCMHDCFGLAFMSTGACYHYSYRADLVVANVKLDPRLKAYVKCSGKNK